MASGTKAIYAIAHARYGNMLKAEDYEKLAGCTSISDVTKYLRDNTKYKTVLSAVKGNDLHRGYLERLIRRHYQQERAFFARFEKTVNCPIYKYSYVKNSVQEILRFIRYFNANRESEYILIAPQNEEYYPLVKISDLANATSYSDILNAIKDKELKKRLLESPNIEKEDKSIDYAKIEYILNEYPLDYLSKLLDNHGKSYKEFKEIFGTKSELQNVEHIYRMKRLDFEPDEIKQYLSGRRNRISSAKMNEMINAPKSGDVIKIFKTTHYKIYSDKLDEENINDYLRTIYYHYIKNKFRYTEDSLISMFAYIILCEFEADNLFRLIEGIRYGLTKEEIDELIIGKREV